MKRLILTLMACSLVLGGFMLQSGCSSDDDESTTDPAPCNMMATTPTAGQGFFTGDPADPENPPDVVGIRWEQAGSATYVAIDLLKGGVVIDTIDDQVSNVYPYYYPWYASTMGQVSGNDFSVRISAVGESACVDTTDNFSILNTTGCSIILQEPPPLDGSAEYDEGDDLLITWDSEFTTNLVDIEMLLDDEYLATIATAVVNTGEYLWSVDSFHEGTGSEYQIRVVDTTLDGCEDISGRFTINDENLCNIGIIAPQENEIWAPGTDQTIVFFGEQTSGTVDIRLYAGAVFVEVIALAVPVADGDYVWTVDDYGWDGPDNVFRIRIADSNDTYCYEVSERFIIRDGL